MGRRIEIDEKELIYLREVKGMTQQELAMHFGVNQRTIWHRLVELGKSSTTKEEMVEMKRRSLEKFRQSEGKGYWKRYYLSEKGKECYRRYYQSEKCKECRKRYLQSKDGKEAIARHSSKHRELGFIPLNEPFLECEAHHIDFDHVIHMPAGAHQSHPHNIWTGEGMSEINALAFNFLEFEKEYREMDGDCKFVLTEKEQANV